MAMSIKKRRKLIAAKKLVKAQNRRNEMKKLAAKTIKEAA